MLKIIPILIFFSSCIHESKKTESANLKKQVDSLPKITQQQKTINDPTNALTGKTQILELNYIVFGCACANWISDVDYEKYQDKGLAKHCIFIEPAADSLELPLYFDASRHFIKISGQFYTRPDYPKGTIQGEEHLDKAKVFRYTTLEVKKKEIDYPSKDDITLILNYPLREPGQWCESKYNNHFEGREYIYLEKANDKLIDADKLFTGENFPIQIKVTGQYVTTVGYPTGYNPGKGNPEPGKVFRYTKIKILQNGEIKYH